MPTMTTASRAALGIGVAVALAAAAPAGAMASAHHVPATHHHTNSAAKHVTVKGLVARHSGRRVTVFARSVKAGARTVHHQRVSVSFAHGVQHSSTMHVGDRIHVSAMGRVSGNHIIVVRDNDETITPAPASLIFGTVDTVDGNQVVINEQNRDDGDRDSGGDRHDGGDDHDGRMNPADHSPGGPGGPGGDNSGQQVVVDVTDATVTVDGSTDTDLAAGDTVAVLGEVTNDTIVAADVFGFTTAPAFARGDITAIDGDTVTLGDDDQGEHHGGDDASPADHGGDDQTLTVSLANVPLALNGDAGASVSDLTVGDKLIVLGSYDATTNAFTAVDAFAFNDNDNNPCGHNGDGDEHHGGRDNVARGGHDDGPGHDAGDDNGQHHHHGGDDHGHHHHGHDGGIDG